MNQPLRQLSIAHLRGSVVPFSLTFEKGKKLTVIYGENGTGKSTICDAFEFIGKGKVGSLENRGLGRTDRYWHSMGKSPNDVAVELETADSTCRASIGSKEVVVVPTDKRPTVEVLRRKQILDLIEAEPGKRYAAISRFVDVGAVETSEGALRQLITELTSSREVAVARVQENQDTIKQFWEAAGKPIPNMFAWAKSESSRDGSKADGEIEVIHSLQGAFSQLLSYPDRVVGAVANLKSAKEGQQAAQAELDRVLANLSQDTSEVVEILQAAQKYLAKHTTVETCPLCESGEMTESLVDRVAHRLTTFSEYQMALTYLKSANHNVQKAEDQLQNWLESASQHVDQFEQCRQSHTWPGDVPLPETAAPKEASQLSEWLSINSHLPVEWKKADAQRQDKKQFLIALKKAYTTWRDNTRAQKELDSLLPRLTKALELMETERKQFTDEKLSEIADRVGVLYEAVHPGEGLNKISLQLDPKKRASLEIGASFCGQDTKPQAYFSDSHLDTLGLCVFLALSAIVADEAKKTILVLDDVLASVDEPHVERLIEMLYSEALRFRHCIITTHYRPWKQKLRWGWLQNGECQFVELTKWTTANGMTIINSIPDIERLRQLIAETPPDCQLVCAKAGVILEAALDFLTLQYECAVPRKHSGSYTVGELLPAISGKLRDVLRVDVMTATGDAGESLYKTVKLGPYLDEIARIAQVRNVFGCHFNQISFDLLDSDGIGFGQQVLCLIEVLVDGEAGWPRNGKSGEYWQTSGGTRRLYPYKKPA